MASRLPAAFAIAAAIGLLGCNLDPQPHLLDVDNIAIEQLNREDALDVTYSVAFIGPGAPDEKQQRAMVAVRRVSAQVRHDLATLFYPVDLNSTRSIRADGALQRQIQTFEQRLVDFIPTPDGVDRASLLAVDGELTWFEFNILHRLAALAQFSPVIGDPSGGGSAPLVQYTESLGFPFVTARGTWVLEGGVIDRPLNWSYIECARQLETCTVWDVSVGEPWWMFPDSSTQFGPSLPEPRSNIWFQVGRGAKSLVIVQWSPTEIVATDDVPGPCGNDHLVLNPNSGGVRLVIQYCDENQRTRREVHVLRGSSPVIADHWDRVLADIERFHGPLAELLYRRPHTGARQ